MNLSKLQSEAVLEFKSKYPKYKYLCRYSDDFKKGEWINIEDVFKFYNDQIQKAYIAGINNPKEIRAETNHLKTLMFGIKLGRIIGVGLSVDKLSIQSKVKIDYE